MNFRRNILIIFLATLLMALLTAARAESNARIIETQPAMSGTLGHGQSFYVRIEYSTDEPISLWARPFLNGKEVKQAMSNASSAYLGSGEALGWFELTGPGEVDEIRIKAGGGKPYRERVLASQPAQLRWTDASAASEPRAAWVDGLIAAEAARMHEDAQRRANEPTSTGTMALMSGFMLFMLALLVAGIGVPLWSVWKWRGGWKIAAAVPAVVIGFVVLRIIVDTARDPTSHNLWPFEIIQFGVVALVIIGILKVARRVMGVQA
ncbi:MAG TPA: hypothetical protein VEZ88_01750 [Steroidobacteraceae bacterium]|nr:hypothetical protein [Steroidobacteraceae bacterium]